MSSFDSDEEMALSYSNYGTAAKVSEPAASEIAEAPQDVYGMYAEPPQQ